MSTQSDKYTELSQQLKKVLIKNLLLWPFVTGFYMYMQSFIHTKLFRFL